MSHDDGRLGASATGSRAPRGYSAQRCGNGYLRSVTKMVDDTMAKEKLRASQAFETDSTAATFLLVCSYEVVTNLRNPTELNPRDLVPARLPAEKPILRRNRFMWSICAGVTQAEPTWNKQNPSLFA